MILSRRRLALPRRRWLLGAAALPAALLLPSCGSSPEVGSCLGPDEEVPEPEPPRLPRGARVRPKMPREGRYFEDQSPAVSPDGTLIAACEAPDRYQLDLADTHGVLLWDTRTGEIVRRLKPRAIGPLAWAMRSLVGLPRGSSTSPTARTDRCWRPRRATARSGCTRPPRTAAPAPGPSRRGPVGRGPWSSRPTAAALPRAASS